MGCIHSTKKLQELKTENVFRVVRLQPDGPQNGYLELTPRELIFTTTERNSVGGSGGTNSDEPIVWMLQQLRRYGLNNDIFKFEAGRRCVTGPGIYTFRCQQADRLYQLFQRYLNEASDEAFTFPDRERTTIGGSQQNYNANQTNNYLEPAPLSGLIRNNLHESFSSSPLSLELDSPDSVPSLSFTNEVVHFQNLSHHPSTPGAACTTNATGNLYLEHPLRAHNEYNNNARISGVHCGSAFSTLSNRTMVKRCSLDAPPEECAPMHYNSVGTGLCDSLHMYANVDNLGMNLRDKDFSERCYENLNRMDIPLLLQPPPHLRREPLKTSANTTMPGAVNYIVLDLDQPRSPSQISPKTCYGSGLSLVQEVTTTTTTTPAITTSETVQSLPATTALHTNNATLPKGSCIRHHLDISNAQSQKLKTSESTLGYSTIDFIKTCALIKSSTHCADFDPDHEESRITRHSKCVRKAYSISE